jgi:spore coat-associated protein N
LKKYLFLILTVLLALGITGGTFAYFTDTETSNGNVFAAGTLDLKISDINEYPPRDGVSVTWSMTNMAPGVSHVGPRTITIINTGSIQGDHIEISFSHQISDLPDVESDTKKDSTPGELAKWLQILAMTYEDTTLVGPIPTPGHVLVDVNHNGFIDLEDVTLPENSLALDNLEPPLVPGGQTSFSMTLLFNAGATNDIQGDTLTTTVYFTLNQDYSQ